MSVRVFTRVAKTITATHRLAILHAKVPTYDKKNKKYVSQPDLVYLDYRSSSKGSDR